MTWSEEQDAYLALAVDSALAILRRLPALLQHGNIQYAVHDEFLDRMLSLERYLSTAVAAIRNGNHSPGFALLRSALEHHLVDHLLLRGRRRIRRGRNITEETYNRWRMAWENGEPGYGAILDMSRTHGGFVTIIDEGARVKDENGVHEYSLSIHYAYFSQSNLLVGSPSEQQYLHHNWLSLEEREGLAREQRDLYEAALRWSSIRDHLEVNGFYSAEELVWLNVHYRFLSAFVHPTPTGDRILQRQHSSYTAIYERTREHIALELGHLYAAALLSRQISVFLQMADDAPRVRIGERHEVERAAAEARTLSLRLWFPGDPPHPYDIAMREQGSRRAPGPSTDERLPLYYGDPYNRLAEIHQSRWQV